MGRLSKPWEAPGLSYTNRMCDARVIQRRQGRRIFMKNCQLILGLVREKQRFTGRNCYKLFYDQVRLKRTVINMQNISIYLYIP